MFNSVSYFVLVNICEIDLKNLSEMYFYAIYFFSVLYTVQKFRKLLFFIYVFWLFDEYKVILFVMLWNKFPAYQSCI